MAEAVIVAAIIPKFITSLESEVRLHQNMSKNLSTIRDELENMKAFLTTDEDASTHGDLLQKAWVNQVRRIALESENIVDEFLLHLARDHHSGSCTCFASMSHSFKNLVAQHAIASRMKDVISRFKTVRESNQRYRTYRASSSKKPSEYNPQHDALFHNGNLVGTETHKRKLIDMLMSIDKPRKVVSVYGMGGVGKTRLVKDIYDDEEVKRNFAIRAWITVSQTSKSDALLKDLILQLYMMRPECADLGIMRWTEERQKLENGIYNLNSVQLLQIASDMISRNRYLIVLDDIWSTDAWFAIRNAFPDSSRGSRLMITTRNKDIALAASFGNREHIFHLQPLNEEHSLTLFRNITFGGGSCPDHLVEVTNRILKQCGGVPLAIVAIIGVLVRKDMSTSLEWETVCRNLGAPLDSTQRVLSLSYNDLPYHLKRCYLYLSIFPEDYLIQKRRLIRLWIAEGFVERNYHMTQEDVAESYLKELVERSLIQVADTAIDAVVDTYIIHDLLREILMEKAKDHDLATVVGEDNKLWPRKVRRLSLHNNLSISQDYLITRQLRTLLLFKVKQPLTQASIPSLFSVHSIFKMLTVLDLQGTILNEFPTNIGKLTNLRYLNLSHTDLEIVPSSIGKLQKLETLDLKFTYVTQLPEEILKLQQLRHLLVYQYNNDTSIPSGFRAPAGIGSLQSLECLLSVDAGQGCCNVARNLGMLTQLRRLSITNFSNQNADALCSSIKKLCNLRVLSVFSSVNSSEFQAMNLKLLEFPSQSLQCLYLTGKLDSLPPLMGTLQNLVKLCLRSSKLQSDPLETLGQLPNLKQLELNEVCTSTELQFKTGKFPELQILGLHKFTSLEKVILQQGTMPKLERFRIASCARLRMVPKDVEHLSMLIVLDFVNMPPEILKAWEASSSKSVTPKDVNWVYDDKGTWKLKRLRTAGNKSNSHMYGTPESFIKRINDLEGL
uniref:Uncharacterized protein n=1 Tax=Kalanchoe fedtschenkoi TaxID=63787 RepID=A0A7N0UXS9_KALFE